MFKLAKLCIRAVGPSNASQGADDLVLLGLGGERRKRYAKQESEPDHPHGHLGLRMAGGSLEQPDAPINHGPHPG